MQFTLTIYTFANCFTRHNGNVKNWRSCKSARHLFPWRLRRKSRWYLCTATGSISLLQRERIYSMKLISGRAENIISASSSGQRELTEWITATWKMHEPQHGWYRDRGGKYKRKGGKEPNVKTTSQWMDAEESGTLARVTCGQQRHGGERHRENVSMWKMSKCLPRSSVKDIWREISWTAGVWRGCGGFVSLCYCHPHSAPCTLS